MSNSVFRVAGFLSLVLFQTLHASAADLLVYFGTQSVTPGTGISLGHFDNETGILTEPKLVIAADGPSYFAPHPDGRHLYSTNFTNAGGLSAYEVDPKSGSLTLINRISGDGAGTSHVNLDRSGRFVLAANFAHGHIAVFPIRPDGGLAAPVAYEQHTGSSVNPKRQTASYPHCIMPDPTNHFCLIPDLGLDKLFVYQFDAQSGALTAGDPPFAAVTPGSGPRHVRFHPNGKWVYLLDEMGSSIVGYDWDSAHGRLTQFQMLSTLAAGFSGEDNSAEIDIHPNGKFLYASNRGEDTLITFAIDPASGKLSLVDRVSTAGKIPRDFALDPTGRWIICTNQQSDNAVLFKVDPDTGRLQQSGEPIHVPAPCGICFMPAALP